MKVVELTDAVVEQLKNSCGGIPLYKEKLNKQEFVFTCINRNSWREIQKWLRDNIRGNNGTVQGLMGEIEARIVSKGLIWPKVGDSEWSLLPAGIESSLARAIAEKSLLDIDGSNPFSFEVNSVSDVPNYPDITDEELATLKRECPHQLYKVRAGDRQFVIRPMLRLEYNSLQKIADMDDQELEGCRKCVLWPKGIQWEDEVAGLTTSIAGALANVSGFTAGYEIEEL